MLDCLLKKKDCMAVLPTGYGKSLPYQMVLPLVRQLKCKDLSSSLDQNEKIIVCCPLVALMNDQVQRLSDIPALRSAFKGSSQQSDEKIKNGDVDIIFASPETLVGDKYWRSALQQLKVGVIVIDEFHTITTWGGEDNADEDDVFRKWFRCVGELRALFPNASVLALSATCTVKIKRQVLKNLNLRPELTTVISVSPNKSNIKLVVKKIDNMRETAMYWLVDAIDTMKEKFPKTLIYTKSIADVSKLYSYVMSELPDCANYVDMFHSETLEGKKQEIIDSLRHHDCNVRVVFATSALGMGIDVSDCHSLIIYGPPHSVLDLVQEVGRIGRDDAKSTAVLFNSYHLRHVSKEVKKVFGNIECRRMELMTNFLTETDLDKLKFECSQHTCCDLCSSKCSCGNCVRTELEELVDNVVYNCSESNGSGSSNSDTVDYKYEPVEAAGVMDSSDDDDEPLLDFEEA